MVFGLGILWTGLTPAGALSGLVIGFILGVAKFIAGNVWPVPECGKVDDRPGFAKMHFMFYGEKLKLKLLRVQCAIQNAGIVSGMVNQGIIHLMQLYTTASSEGRVKLFFLDSFQTNSIEQEQK